MIKAMARIQMPERAPPRSNSAWTSDEVAVATEWACRPAASEPAGNGAEGEASGGVTLG